jgi:acyl-CoA synthetase (AMP-forming)/AMP-acid ligase II
VAYNGSEPVRRSTLEAFQRKFGVCGFRWESFSPAYGLAESTLLVASIPAGTAPELRGDDVASGLLHDRESRVRIVDPVTRTPVRDGMTGEIWVSSESVARGYWNRPQQTAETFEAYTSNGNGPYLRTGDLGVVHCGRLFITGRMKDLLIVRGVKYHPHDIELAAERSHPCLRAGCCAAVAMPVEGEERVAIVAELDSREHNRAEGVDLAQVIIAMRIAVSSVHHLSLCSVSLVPAGTLPKTTSGKLQRFLCREALLAGSLHPLAAWSDQTSAERVAS